jgi:hypothetical protein
MRAELKASIRRQSRENVLKNYANGLLAEAIDMSIEEPDYGEWQQGGSAALVGGREYRELLTQDAQRLRAMAWRLYWDSSHIRNVIRTLVKFVFGKGVTIKLNEDRPDIKKKAEDYMKKWSKDNKWPLKQKEMAARSWRDGEAFVHTRNLDIGRPPRLEFANPDIVQSDKPDATYGIRMDPDDPTMPYEYILKKNPSTNEEVIISAKDMVHIKTCVDSDIKRGRTILEPILRHTRMYDDWMKDRLVLNKVRSALAVVRVVNGTPNQIKSIQMANRSDRAGAAGLNRQKTWRPGTIITAPPGVDYKMLSANINATDAAQDGRNILLAMAVGVGFPDMYMTGDWQKTNFASSAVAQNPFIRECEDQQDFFEPHIEDIIEQVFNVGIENGELPEDMDKSVNIEWPPLIQRDLVSLVTALMQLFKEGILSRQTLSSQTGFDWDLEKKLRFEEDAERAMEQKLLGIPPPDPTQPPPAPGAGGGPAPKPKQTQAPRPQGQAKQKVKLNTKK